jgi:hypothetical protein
MRTEESGFEQAESIEALVVDDDGRSHEDEVMDLVAVADYLTPELHRGAGAEDAVAVVSEWADHDAELLHEAEMVAEHAAGHDESATLLHQAADTAAA